MEDCHPRVVWPEGGHWVARLTSDREPEKRGPILPGSLPHEGTAGRPPGTHIVLNTVDQNVDYDTEYVLGGHHVKAKAGIAAEQLIAARWRIDELKP